MMDYPFKKLERLRCLREQSAQADLIKGRHRLDRADRELCRKQEALERHCAFQAEMITRLFDEIGSKEMKPSELDRYCGRVSDLCNEGKKCRERVWQAEEKRDSAQQDVNGLSAVFHLRCKQRTTLAAMRDAWFNQVREEENRRQEEEMEEMTQIRFAGNEASSGSDND